MLILHGFRDFEPPQAFDLPLRRSGPERVRAPANVVGTETFDERSHKGSAYIRLGNERGREKLANVTVHVRHTVLGRDVGEIAGPG